jgi:hypothetical protein
VLKFSQQLIGHLRALGALAAVGGAFIYAPLSRQVPLKRLINASIGMGVAGTLAYCSIGTPGRPLSSTPSSGA